MDEQRAVFIGIDVSKDRLDVHLRPSGEAFCVSWEEKRLGDLVSGLEGLPVALVVLQATGGFEAIVAAVLPALGCHSVSSIRARSAISPGHGPPRQGRYARC
jgi:transposase